MKEYTELHDDKEYRILVGNNDMENDELISKYNDTNYIWFHLKSFPSSHVLVLDNDPPEDVIRIASNICKSATKYRNLKNLKINYTPMSNIEKAEKLGSVIFRSNRKVKNITI